MLFAVLVQAAGQAQTWGAQHGHEVILGGLGLSSAVVVALIQRQDGRRSREHDRLVHLLSGHTHDADGRAICQIIT